MTEPAAGKQQVELVGVRIELPHSQPVVLLRHPLSEKYIPIFIGAPEAAAIALEQQQITTPRPMTHDLLVSVVKALDSQVIEVEITRVDDTVFYAELVLANGARVDARASDALAIAIRVDCPIFVAADVLAQAGLTLNENGDEVTSEENEEVDEEAEMAKFREFLDDVNPDDFSQQ
ncbi:bifunctional nuclease family protein [Micrococcoides hystricis]|uniref:Bifunctional nuclease family protein n=1 Tax=Micrococcoides hystricis TaxID=1572761 RepID=A0ABV6P6Q8_9MICC